METNEKNQKENAQNTEDKVLREWSTPQLVKEDIESTAGGPKLSFPLIENLLYGSGT